MKMQNRWTDDVNKKLLVLIELGLSASQIAMKLGPEFTRNMVIGRTHRTGIRLRGISNNLKNKDGLTKPPKVAPTRKKTPQKTDLWTRNAKGHAEWPTAPVLPPPAPVTRTNASGHLMELEPSQCRYTIDHDDGGHVFCGRPGKPWCPGHRRIVYPPSSQRRLR